MADFDLGPFERRAVDWLMLHCWTAYVVGAEGFWHISEASMALASWRIAVKVVDARQEPHEANGRPLPAAMRVHRS